MSKLFETSEINGMKLANRLVRSATWEGMAADDGACTPKLIDLMAGLAKGGVGLIISGSMPVGNADRETERSTYTDCAIAGIEELPETVHRAGNGCKVVHGTLDVDPFPIEVYGNQPGAAWHGHYHAKIPPRKLKVVRVCFGGEGHGRCQGASGRSGRLWTGISRGPSGPGDTNDIRFPAVGPVLETTRPRGRERRTEPTWSGARRPDRGT